MKKIFLPLLALCGMIAGFSLTSCGGGGGGDGTHNFSGKTIRYFGNTMAGSMVVAVYDKKTTGIYSADVSFGENGTPYAAEFRIVNNTNNPEITVQLEGDENFSTDEDVRMFFSDFLPSEFDVEAALYGFPAPKITMHYLTDVSGTYVATYSFLVGDNPETEDVNEGDDPETPDVIEEAHMKEIDIKDLNFSYIIN